MILDTAWLGHLPVTAIVLTGLDQSLPVVIINVCAWLASGFTIVEATIIATCMQLKTLLNVQILV